MRHDQDIANLILFLQSEIALYQTTGDRNHLDSCLVELERAIDDLEVRPWYNQLLLNLKDQVDRLDEWS